nr:unnamed protein product [Callosobruchus chinensis]
MDEKHTKTIIKRKFRPFKQFRYLPGSVSIQRNKADLAQYNQHRFKCFYASPKVDCYPAKLNPYNIYNTKKLREQLTKTQLIDKENKDLLKKINLINRHGGKVDTFNKDAYKRLEFWRGHEHKMHKIVEHNKKIYETLVSAVSRYPTASMLAEWSEMLHNIMHSCQFPFIILAKEDKDKMLAAQPSISEGLPLSPQPMARPKCFMDFKVDKGEYLGRIIIELYFEYVPVTVQNFLEICKGTSNLTYKNCPVHSIIRGKYLETGDITLGTGRGGTSVYGDSFQEENHVLKHSKAGVLSMKRMQHKTENNSQFCISLSALEEMDHKNVVFGKIVKGSCTIFKIEGYGRKIGKPFASIRISNCGAL